MSDIFETELRIGGPVLPDTLARIADLIARFAPTYIRQDRFLHVRGAIPRDQTAKILSDPDTALIYRQPEADLAPAGLVAQLETLHVDIHWMWRAGDDTGSGLYLRCARSGLDARFHAAGRKILLGIEEARDPARIAAAAAWADWRPRPLAVCDSAHAMLAHFGRGGGRADDSPDNAL